MNKTVRYEYKYMISYLDYIKLRPLISSLLTHDKQAETDEYIINSVYFDDVYHSGAMDKAFGNEVHRKFRVRYYDNQNEMKLELKEKIGDLSTKYSTWISNEIYDAIRDNNLDVLERHFDNDLVRRFTLEQQLKLLKPICNIRYKREAYKDQSNNLRVTFDFDLDVARYPTCDHEDYIKLMNDTKMILEVKYEHYLPKEIKACLKAANLNQIAYSKYFMGYQQLQF